MSEEKKKAKDLENELSDQDLAKVLGGQTINPASPPGTGVVSVDEDGYVHDCTKPTP